MAAAPRRARPRERLPRGDRRRRGAHPPGSARDRRGGAGARDHAEPHQERLPREQRERLFPLALELATRHGIPVKLDCSAAPFVAWHAPDAERLEQFEVAGCIGSLSLLGVDERGKTSACSFYPGGGDDVVDLARGWEASAAYAPFRNYVDTAEEPCRSCPYLRTCRGGCRAVALFLTRRDDAPDPECPRVEDHQRARL